MARTGSLQWGPRSPGDAGRAQPRSARARAGGRVPKDAVMVASEELNALLVQWELEDDYALVCAQFGVRRTRDLRSLSLSLSAHP